MYLKINNSNVIWQKKIKRVVQKYEKTRQMTATWKERKILSDVIHKIIIILWLTKERKSNRALLDLPDQGI